MATARWVLSFGLMCALVSGLACGVLGADEEKPVASPIASPAGSYSPSGSTTIEGSPALVAPAATSEVPAANGKTAAMPGKSETPGHPSAEPAAKTKESIKPIHRPSAPATSPNSDEFKVRPDAAGRIRLNFNGQPWRPVLEWLAKISNMSLDWQELPGDSINLTTQRSYTVAEVRDLLNRLLLARGFTLLSCGEVLTAVEIKNLDPSLVPRVEATDLAKHDPYEYVKVSFLLVSLAAETAAEELKPMVSPNGWLTPLNETNRLEIMDAVTNLRDIDAVLKEQIEDNLPRSFREFKLKHRRAEEVHSLLATLLGIESKPRPGFEQSANMMNPGQQAAMMAGMQMQPGGMPGQQGPNAVPSKPKGPMAVSMVANERNNSLLVRAGPDKMAVIAQVVEHVDIPVSHDDSLLVNLNRMQVYRLAGIDPEPVVKTLMEIGNLDPATRLEVDKKNSAVIAYAPLSDHVTIRAVVDKLVGSERKFEVIRLHRLAADYVAGTIDFMMGSGKKEKTRSSPYYFSNDSSRREAGENSKEFHVEADVEHNRLLLWANPVELTAVEALLAKLGEIPASGNGSGNIRVIDGGDARQTQELIERIRRAWPSIAPNALEGPAADSPLDGSKEPIPRLSPPPKDLPTSLPSPSPSPSPLPSSAAGQAQAALLLIDVPRPPAAGTAEERAVDERAAGDRTAGERTAADSRPAPPPVKITVGPDGKLIVTSQDGLALDRLEELAAQLAIPRKDFHVFHLKYASAFGVSLNLEDFFKEEKKQPARMMPWWYNDSDSQNDADSERRLSKRRKLTFISDTDSNTILVEGASAEQLKTIEDLIQVYDQPPPRDTQSARRTEVIRLKYSKAKALADTVKDVYRDLLSPDDKALAVNNQGRETRRTIIFDNGDSDNKEQKTPKFKGLLSIGVDEISNSLTISAPAYLFEHVTRLINELDQAAAPDYTVRMVRVDGMSASRVKELVDRVYNQKSGENPPAEERPAKKPAAPAKKLSSRAGRGAGEAGSEGTEEAH